MTPSASALAFPPGRLGDSPQRPDATRSGPGRALTVLFAGMPVWWLLGMAELAFLVATVPMAVFLVRNRIIRVPSGFGVWLLWLAWLLLGVMVLQVDVAGTVGGANPGRYLTFAYRYAWYVAATVVALFVLNARHILSAQKVAQSVAWLFVVMIGGGLLGLLAPGIQLSSALQVLLPHGIATNGFVEDLIQIRAAQIQQVLGTPQPRPSAPFSYTNEWGFITALSMPLFVVAWWSRGRHWRVALVGVLAVALVVIIASLNRGMWVAILSAISLVVIQSAVRGRMRALLVSVVVVAAGVVVVLTTPLGEIILERLANGVSDEGRESLAVTALSTAAQGSPIVGFGTTRDLAGTFNSIAGGASSACPDCEPPPIGTHGQLWFVVFTTGFVGLALFVGFLLSQFLRHLRARTPHSVAALATVLMLIVTLPTYNSIGVPLFVGFIAVGLLARDDPPPLRSLGDCLRLPLRHIPAIVACVLIGGMAGAAAQFVLGSPVVATQRVLVPAAPLTPVPETRPSTLDGEAALVLSDEVVTRVASRLDRSAAEVRSSIHVGAEPNTRILLISYESPRAAEARVGVEESVDAFLAARAQRVATAIDSVDARYADRQRELAEIYRATYPWVGADANSHLATTLTTINQQWARAATVIDTMHQQQEAREISTVYATTMDDLRTVRIASGLSLGLLVGLLSSVLLDRRFPRASRRHAIARLGIPVIASVSSTNVDGALSAVRRYAPVAGVIADVDSAAAMRFATRLDAALPDGVHSDARTIVVIDQHSLLGHVRRLFARLEHMGLEPVGLILLGANSRSANRSVR